MPFSDGEPVSRIIKNTFITLLQLSQDGKLEEVKSYFLK